MDNIKIILASIVVMFVLMFWATNTFGQSQQVENDNEAKSNAKATTYSLSQASDPNIDSRVLERPKQKNNTGPEIEQRAFELKDKKLDFLSNLDNDPLGSFKMHKYEKAQGFISLGIKGFLQLADNLYLSATKTPFELKEQILGGGFFYLNFRFGPIVALEFDIGMQGKGIYLSNGMQSQIWYLSLVPYIKLYPAKEIFFLGVGPSLHIPMIENIVIPNVKDPKATPFIVGLSLGLGVEFTHYPFFFILEYRFDFGLNSILSISDTIISNLKAYPLVFADMQFMIGFGWYVF